MKWIHLSDIHFDPKNDGRNVYQLRKKLLQYIKVHRIKADHLFITGDFRYAGNQERVDNVILFDTVKFILHVADAAEVAYSNIHIVPGNHDLDRTNKVSRIEEILKKYNVQEGKFEQDDLKFLIKRFKFYKKIIIEFENQGAKLACSSTLMPLHTLQSFDDFNLLSLNTSIICNSDADRGNLIIGNYELYNALENMGENVKKPIIVIAHHGLDNFRVDERKAIEQIFADYPICLYLCGDAHNSWERKINNFIEITMGCLTFDQTVRTTFSVGELLNKEYSIEAHEWNADLCKWGEFTQFNEKLCRWPLSGSTNNFKLKKKVYWNIKQISGDFKKSFTKNTTKYIYIFGVVILMIIGTFFVSNNKVKLALAGENKFVFVLENDYYKLPTPYQAFVRNGWQLSSFYNYKETDVLKSKQFISVYMVKEDISIKVILMNTTDNTLPLNECLVGGISLCQNCGTIINKIEFEMVKGITLLSALNDIQNAYGNPTDKGRDIQRLYYTYNDPEETKIFHFESYLDDDNTTPIINKIELINLEGINYVSPKPYFYQNNYVPPNELGSKLDSNIIRIDEKLYLLPCPLSEFIDDGWNLVEPTNVHNTWYTVLNRYGDSCGWNLKKDEKFIVIRARNYLEQAVFFSPDSAVVDYIYIEQESDDDFIHLPCGLTENSSIEEIEKVLSDISNDINSSFNYEKNVDFYDRRQNISVSISNPYIEINYTISNYRAFSFECEWRYDE